MCCRTTEVLDFFSENATAFSHRGILGPGTHVYTTAGWYTCELVFLNQNVDINLTFCEDGKDWVQNPNVFKSITQIIQPSTEFGQTDCVISDREATF